MLAVGEIEPAYEVDGQYVTFRGGRRLIRNPGDPGWVETFDRIPIVDFGDIDHPDFAVREKIAKDLADAAEHCGFFYAANTPVSDKLMEATFTALEEFFALPEEAKLACDWSLTPGARGYESFGEVKTVAGGGKAQKLRESFLMGDDFTEPEQWSGPIPEGVKPQNIWPSELPKFRKAIYDYYHVVFPFCRSLLRLFAIALGLEETALDSMHKFPIMAIRGNHNPPQTPEEDGGRPGFPGHADFSIASSIVFTLVLQKAEYGSALEVLNLNGHWVPAPPLPGTRFTCNVGDYLEQLSGGRFVSTIHRVVNHSGVERYSLPFFFSPDPSAVLKPVVGPSATRYESKVATRSVGHHYVVRLLHSRTVHPTTLRVKELGIPEDEWDYSYLTGSLL